MHNQSARSGQDSTPVVIDVGRCTWRYGSGCWTPPRHCSENHGERRCVRVLPWLGLSAGIAGNTLTNPIWLVKTRMQLLADASAGQRQYTSYTDVIQSIYREEGIGGFYKGMSASYWGCTEGAIQFILYEKIKGKLLDQQNARRIQHGLEPTDKLPKLTYFCSAAVAKGIASMATYSHEVARTRLREQARDGVFKYTGMWQTIGLIGKEEGRKGLYGGMGVHLAKVVPNSAIMFLTYEVVNSWLSGFTVVDR